MRCDRCNKGIGDGEEKKLHGRLLCEDCCMDLLSPPRACDPWAVFSASRCGDQTPEDRLRPVQRAILAALGKEGPMSSEALCARLRISGPDLERELATLRHMEKVRGALRNGQRLLMLWNTDHLEEKSAVPVVPVTPNYS